MDISSLFNGFGSLFKGRSEILNLEKLIKHLGSSQNEISLHNGYSIWGEVNDEERFKNKHVKVNVGYVRSGHGDWGGGFEYASTAPIQITINKDFHIISIEFDDFYNSSDDHKEIRRQCEKYIGKQELKRLYIPDEQLMNAMVEVINKYAGKKEYIGGDGKFKYPNI